MIQQLEWSSSTLQWCNGGMAGREKRWQSSVRHSLDNNEAYFRSKPLHYRNEENNINHHRVASVGKKWRSPGDSVIISD